MAERVIYDDDPRRGYFGRVDDRHGEPLTKAEVFDLPENTEVIVIWSGGNGPHYYWVRRAPYFRLVSKIQADMETVGHNITSDPMHDFIGARKYHTRVWRADARRDDRR